MVLTPTKCNQKKLLQVGCQLFEEVALSVVNLFPVMQSQPLAAE